MNATLYDRMEIMFWKVAIQLMTRSRLVRGVVRSGNRLFKEMALPDPVKTISLIALAGFASGFILYSIVLTMR